ncbi:hypothetical protein LCGC14_0258810 [marine sediment metagenome]|uniref:LamG-like jellyroll fold domain-containing protein n=1 Tax=marine sediment metagenome TaxID=412755 RepID=A0A0F9WMT5_9ZZZZ
MSRFLPPVTDGLVLAVLPYANSLLDHSGAGRHPSLSAVAGMEWIRSNGVMQLRATGTGLLTVANDATIEAITDNSFFVGVSGSDPVSQARWFSKRDAGGTQLDVYADTATTVGIYDGIVARAATMGSWAGVHSFALNFPSGGAGDLFRNGVPHAAFSGVSTFSGHTADISIGNQYTGTKPLSKPQFALLWYSRILAAWEHSLNHAWSESLRSPSLPHNRRFFDMGSLVEHGNANGEVASYDFSDVTGRSAPDRSGGGYTATLVGPVMPVNTEVGRALSFDGDTSRATLASDVVGNAAVSFSALVRANSSGGAGGGRLIDNTKFLIYFRSANRISLSSNGGVTKIESPASSILYKNWHHLVVTRDAAGAGEIYIDGAVVITGATGTPVAAAAVVLGNRAAGTRGWDGDIKNVILHNRILDGAEVKVDYAKIARKVMYQLKLDQVPPTFTDVLPGQVIPGTDYTVRTGAFAVREDPATSENYIVCVTAGVYTRPNPFASGTSEFDVEKGGGTNSLNLLFSVVAPTDWTDPAQNGYMYQFSSTERAVLRRITAGGSTPIAMSDAAYVVNNQRYKIRISVSSVGVFTAYIMGGTFANWTLVSAAGGGSNPVTDTTHTTSVYTVFDFDAGDRQYGEIRYLGVVKP